MGQAVSHMMKEMYVLAQPRSVVDSVQCEQLLQQGSVLVCPPQEECSTAARLSRGYRARETRHPQYPFTAAYLLRSWGQLGLLQCPQLVQ